MALMHTEKLVVGCVVYFLGLAHVGYCRIWYRIHYSCVDSAHLASSSARTLESCCYVRPPLFSESQQFWARTTRGNWPHIDKHAVFCIISLCKLSCEDESVCQNP